MNIITEIENLLSDLELKIEEEGSEDLALEVRSTGEEILTLVKRHRMANQQRVNDLENDALADDDRFSGLHVEDVRRRIR